MAGRSGQVIDISFYLADKLPRPLVEVAKIQGFELSDGLIAVKTLFGFPPTYEFQLVGNSPEDIKEFMGQLALEDGVDIDTALMRAFGKIH